MGREGTDQAARRGRRAQRRAELHQALVEITGCRALRQRGHQLAGGLPQRSTPRRGLDVNLDPAHARQHASHVAVDERRAFAECDRRDRAGGVRPDALDLEQLAGPRRQLACEPRVDLFRTGVQRSRARVVPEPGPQREHVVERCGRERRHRRKLRHPALPVRDHGGHARLLQHHLADPDRVRVARAPPRQVAAHRLIVRDHGLRDRSHMAEPSGTSAPSRTRSGRIRARSSCGSSPARSSDPSPGAASRTPAGC